MGHELIHVISNHCSVEQVGDLHTYTHVQLAQVFCSTVYVTGISRYFE
jgi:hypothetical protein